MFDRWKAARSARKLARALREAAELKIATDAYLRRLKNSAKGLTGTTHSGPGCDNALDPYEIRAVLRERLSQLAPADGDKQSAPTTYQWPAFEVVQKWALENGHSGASDDEAYQAYKHAHPQVVGAAATDGADHG